MRMLSKTEGMGWEEMTSVSEVTSFMFVPRQTMPAEMNCQIALLALLQWELEEHWASQIIWMFSNKQSQKQCCGQTRPALQAANLRLAYELMFRCVVRMTCLTNWQTNNYLQSWPIWQENTILQCSGPSSSSCSVLVSTLNCRPGEHDQVMGPISTILLTRSIAEIGYHEKTQKVKVAGVILVCLEHQLVYTQGKGNDPSHISFSK